MIKSKFSKKHTAEQVTEGIDLSGKTVVITGINSGIGKETFRVLAKRGAHIIGTGRTLEKAVEACNQVGGDTTPLACELSDLKSVKACADAVKATGKPIDILICNAGMSVTDLQVIDGLEIQFLANHMGHFLLIRQLLDQIKAAEAGRIVMLSSDAIKMSPKSGIDFDNLDGGKGFKFGQFYGQSKLANLLTAVALTNQLEGTAATANAVHPGVINTGLTRHGTGAIGWFLKSALFEWIVNNLMGGKSVEQGASTECYVATSPDLDGISGKYFADNNQEQPPFKVDPAVVNRLWEYSENYITPYV